MKHLFTLFFFAIIFLAAQCRAQSQFTKLIYEQPSSSLHSDVSLSTVDNGVIDFGRTYTSPFIIKLDSTGDVKWSKFYSYDANPSFSYLSACNSQDSTYAAVGITYSVNPYVNTNAYCVKFKANGDTLWSRKLSKSGWTFMRPYSISSTLDSGFIISGHGLGSANFEAFILKLSKKGTLSWMKVLNGYGISYAAKQTSDSGYVMTGQKSSLQMQECIVLSKLDKNGNLSWQKAYCENPSGNSSQGYDVLVEKQSYLIAVGTNSSAAAIIKTDLSGNIIWAKRFSYSVIYSSTTLPELRPFSLKKTLDKGYLLAYNGGSSGAGFSIKTDSLANCEWKTSDNYTMIQMTQLKNKSFFLIGNQPDIVVKASGINSAKYEVLPVIIRDSLGVNTSSCAYSFSTSSQAFVFSVTVVTSTLTSAGSSSAIHPTLTAFSVLSQEGCLGIPGGITEAERNSYKLFPNPSSGNFSITSDTYLDKIYLKIQDITGRLVFEQILNSGEMERIDMNVLQSGVYLYSLSSESRLLKTGKLILLK